MTATPRRPPSRGLKFDPRKNTKKNKKAKKENDLSEENANETDPRFYAIRNAAYADLDEASRLLASDPTLIHVENSIGETACHFLVVENEFPSVEWLLGQGAEINTQNDFGNTPLMEAATLGYFEMCRFLLAHGADLSIKDKTDDTAISGVAYRGRQKVLELLLSYLPPEADINDYFHWVMVEMILEKGGAIAEILKARGLQVSEEA